MRPGIGFGPRPAAPHGPYGPSAGVAPKAEVPKQNPMVQALAIGFALLKFMVHTIPSGGFFFSFFLWCPPGLLVIF